MFKKFIFSLIVFSAFTLYASQEQNEEETEKEIILNVHNLSTVEDDFILDDVIFNFAIIREDYVRGPRFDIRKPPSQKISSQTVCLASPDTLSIHIQHKNRDKKTYNYEMKSYYFDELNELLKGEPLEMIDVVVSGYKHLTASGILLNRTHSDTKPINGLRSV